jgi:hypothetical protein
MFCPKCGKELPDESLFCLKCGHTLSGAAAPAPAKSKAGMRAFVGTLVLGFLIAIIVWQNFSSSNKANGSGPVAPIPFIRQAHAQVLANSAITVQAASYVWYRFEVPAGATNISVDGHFSAAGGVGNDIDVVVLADDAFVNFKNHHTVPTYYNTGKLTQSSINAVLPSGGTYYLVFNNEFSLITPKAVQFTATLHYTN